MSDIAVHVENLSKLYHIGSSEGYKALLATFSGALLAPFRGRQPARGSVGPREDSGAGAARGALWALKDLSFEIKHGEVVGVIGSNGAGKSTLLKILSRITEPTDGFADVYGRVGSLLEVGTGFHPELTGRENIFLNGAILGMKKTEIKRKFDEIVDFSEIEKFIDTPVKRYSSGMYVRLAFAVAAHLEPEILVVDEVLAVGDVAFQKKCLGKMGDVAKQGRTVLFVSHDMGAIHQLCDYAFLLRSGELCNQGLPETVIANYLTDTVQSGDGNFDFSNHPARATNHAPIIQHVTLRGSDGTPRALFYPGDSLQIELSIAPLQAIRNPRLAVSIEGSYGSRIMTLASYFEDQDLADIEAPCRISCTVPQLRLGSGRYLISVSIGTKYSGLLDAVNNGAWFEVGWRNNFGNGEPYHSIYGPVLERSIWQRVD